MTLTTTTRSNIWTELSHAEVVKYDSGDEPKKRFDAIAHYLLAQSHLCPILPVSQRPTLIGFNDIFDMDFDSRVNGLHFSSSSLFHTGDDYEGLSNYLV